MSGIAAVIFKQDRERAHRAFKQIVDMVDSELIKLTTVTVAERDDKGKVALHETHAWDPKHRKRWGGFWGLLLGLAFAGPLIGLAAGLGLGALIGRRSKQKKQQQFAQDLADNMEPGDSAVFVSFELVNRQMALEQLGKLGGIVIADELSEEDKERMDAALEKEEVNLEVAGFKADARKEYVDKSAEYGIQNIE